MKGFSRLMEDRIYFFFLEFAGKVELDMLKIHLSHLENIITVGKENICLLYTSDAADDQ